MVIKILVPLKIKVATVDEPPCVFTRYVAAYRLAAAALMFTVTSHAATVLGAVKRVVAVAFAADTEPDTVLKVPPTINLVLLALPVVAVVPIKRLPLESIRIASAPPSEKAIVSAAGKKIPVLGSPDVVITGVPAAPEVPKTKLPVDSVTSPAKVIGVAIWLALMIEVVAFNMAIPSCKQIQ
jgi:hypothetical protein